MTDRELLETAAKAAGLDVILWCGPRGWLCETLNGSPRFYWNPLEDDGDALRMAVKLGTKYGMRIEFGPGGVCITLRGQAFDEFQTPGEAFDPAANFRRAITRAAAALA